MANPIFCYTCKPALIYNTIFKDNYALDSRASSAFRFSDGTNVTVFNCTFEGNYGGMYGVVWGSVNDILFDISINFKIYSSK